MRETSNIQYKNSITPHFILDNIGELIIIYDKNNKFLFVSPSYCQLFCRKQNELVGKDYEPVIFEDDVNGSQKTLQNLETPPFTCHIERREQTNIGWRWIAWSNKAIKGLNGETESVICVGRDITEKKESEEKIKQENSKNESVTKDLQIQNYNYGKITKELVKRNNEIIELYELLKESETRFSNMFAKHSSIMFIADPETYDIIDANLAAQKFYGYTEDEFVTKNLAEISVDPLEKLIEKTKKARKSQKQYITSKHILCNGKKKDVEVHSVSIIYEREKVIFSIVYDITARVKAEKKLARSEAKLREANQAKDKFFSIIAHDLKNPFNAISGLSDFMLSHFPQMEKKNMHEFVENINKVSHQTYALLENLLQWARTQMGKIEINIEAVNINKLIVEEVELLKNSAKNKEVEILVDLDENYDLFADKNMIATVIRNLITNAIKFSYRGGKIFILAEKTKSKITISIVDEGQGIPQQNLKKLFDIGSSYSKVGTEKEKGTGLGLIICKEFVESCKGKIGVDSEENKGSRFYFTLPRA